MMIGLGPELLRSVWLIISNYAPSSTYESVDKNSSSWPKTILDIDFYLDGKNDYQQNIRWDGVVDKLPVCSAPTLAHFCGILTFCVKLDRRKSEFGI